MTELEVRITARTANKCRCWNVARDGHALDCHDGIAQLQMTLNQWLTCDYAHRPSPKAGS